MMQEIATKVRADATKISFCSGVVRRGCMLGLMAVVLIMLIHKMVLVHFWICHNNILIYNVVFSSRTLVYNRIINAMATLKLLVPNNIKQQQNNLLSQNHLSCREFFPSEVQQVFGSKIMGHSQYVLLPMRLQHKSAVDDLRHT